MVALSETAGEDIFGRGNGHMSVSPILAVVTDIHSSAGESTNCPLNSKSLSDWMKDSFSRYSVTNRAAKNVCISLQESESPMTFEGYNFVCLQALKMKES